MNPRTEGKEARVPHERDPMVRAPVGQTEFSHDPRRGRGVVAHRVRIRRQARQPKGGPQPGVKGIPLEGQQWRYHRLELPRASGAPTVRRSTGSHPASRLEVGPRRRTRDEQRKQRRKGTPCDAHEGTEQDIPVALRVSNRSSRAERAERADTGAQTDESFPPDHLCGDPTQLLSRGLWRGADLDGIGFDGQAAWECLNAAQNANCSHADWVPLCARVSVPELEAGESCTIDPQCVGNRDDEAHCARVDDTPGTCVAAPRTLEVALGEPCWATKNPQGFMTGTENPQGDDVCALEDGLFCDSNGTCAPAGAVGDACRDPFECALLTHCSAEYTCAPNLNLGASCDHPYTTACGFGNYCDDEGTCAEVKPRGTACSDDRECSSYDCSDEGACVDIGHETVCDHYGSIELGD